MKKENKLVKKVKRLLRRLGQPRWLHHYGPKTYEFYEHLCALLIRFFSRLSFRRVKQLCDLLDLRCPSKSALHYTSKKLSASFWQRVLKVTCGNSYLVALDSTGLSRTNPSYHYLKRIDGKIPYIPIKLSAAFDTKRKKFCAAKVRVLPAHDIRDAKYLLQHSNANIAAADKAYNAESLYAYAEENETLLMAPEKSNVKRGKARKRAQKRFRIRTYRRRALVEASFSSVKRKYGSSVKAKKVRTIRTEVYGRLACHNIMGRLHRLLGQSRKGNSYRE